MSRHNNNYIPFLGALNKGRGGGRQGYFRLFVGFVVRRSGVVVNVVSCDLTTPPALLLLSYHHYRSLIPFLQGRVGRNRASIRREGEGRSVGKVEGGGGGSRRRRRQKQVVILE